MQNQPIHFCKIEYSIPLHWNKILCDYAEKNLLKMVRSVSEDKLYDTIEFNEFLQMMSKQEEEEINMDTLVEAFK